MFKITPSATPGITELDSANTFTLPMPEAMMLIEHLGLTANHSDQGIHSWYGKVTMEGGIKVERPFILTIDQWGNSVVRIRDQNVENLFPRALSVMIEERLPQIIQIQIR